MADINLRDYIETNGQNKSEIFYSCLPNLKLIKSIFVYQNFYRK